MHRFFIGEDQIINGNEACITGSDADHAKKVLRLREDDAVIILDGKGMEYTGRIITLDGKVLRVALGAPSACAAEPSVEATLFQCLPKAGKMDLIIQKTVELGISRIVPVLSHRCVARPEAGDMKKRVTRYQRIAYEAAKQCGRGIIPKVHDAVKLEEASEKGAGLLIFADEEEKDTSLKRRLRGAQSPEKVSFLIGPEGGLAREEAKLLALAGWHPVTLGKRILRTETAPIALLAMLMYELEG